MKKIIIVILVIAALWFLFWKDDQVRLGPGVLAPDDPIQEKIISPERFTFKNYTVTPLAEFHIKAKILSKKNYSWGRESELSPVDLALGWGKMSDESILDAIKVSQSNRWYHWRTDTFPISKREIETHSANMHIVPADEQIESAVKSSHRGDIIELSGSLIRVDAKDGWHWVSSTSRKDSGGRSCEVVWVEEFEVHQF